VNKYSNFLLEAQGIHKTFSTPSGSITVLKNIDLQVRAGESVSISGESGTGKTTLLYIIAGLEKPDQGSVMWDHNFSITSLRAAVAKKRGQFMGFVFQSYHLFPELTVLENALFPARLLKQLNVSCMKRAHYLLEYLGLSKRMHVLPQYLSGGERQRLAVARALIHQPALILADEPTGNLDEETGGNVLNLLLQLCKEENRSLVLVTHNPVFAKKTDRALTLTHGQFISTEK
jgi:ABC-type lipoprotein export system ATPase subunit